MNLIRFSTVLLLAVAVSAPCVEAQAPAKKKLLVIGQTKGFQHDSTSSGMAILWKLGQESGLWDTYFKTDTQLVTKKKLGANAKNLDYFDAVAFFTSGELDMDDEQKADLLSFIKQDGKGFIGVHCATDTLYKWPEYGEMLGGYFDQHPWGTFNAPILVDDTKSPITRHLPKEFTVYDEIYQMKDYYRDKVRVLMRLDEKKLDLSKKGVHRTDGDFAVTWVKQYGNGRVFYSTLGHTEESWKNPDIQKMWMEGVKWALKLSEVETAPIAKPSN